MAKALHVSAIVLGWAALAQAFSQLTSRPDVVWPAAAGLFLLSVAGWGHLRVVAQHGLYSLSRKPE